MPPAPPAPYLQAMRTFTGFGAPTTLFATPELVDKYDAGYGSPTVLFAVEDVAEYDPGYGTPVTVTSLVPAAAAVYPDEGGWMVALRGEWPILGPYRVRLVDAEGTYYPTDGPGCYSGLAGQAAGCRTNLARDTLRFALPRLPLGVYGLEVKWGEAFSEGVLEDEVLRVVRANRCEDRLAMVRGMPYAR